MFSETVTRGSTDPDRSYATERDRAHLRAFELIVDVQSAVPGAAHEIVELLTEAQRRSWPEVVRAALFARAVAAGTESSGDLLSPIERLLERAERDGAVVMTALALALRSHRMTIEGHPEIAVTADDDLARATILLESAEGLLVERISAHNACAQGYTERWLWELADEQYAAALRLAPDAPAPYLRFCVPALVYNRAEMQVNWACVLRQLGDTSPVTEERWHTWTSVMSSAGSVDMPEHWSTELKALEAVIAALTGREPAVDPEEQLGSIRRENHPGAWPVGWLHLALALSNQAAGRLERAAAHAEQAVREIDELGSPDPYDLALFVAAELEGQGARPCALRYARRQLQLRWDERTAVLGSMNGRLQVERLKREHDVVTQQAHLDDLTGLSNRRGFARYLDAIKRQGVATISLLLADLDDFKIVNDRFGHTVGDKVLMTISHLLEGHVRQADCAVRLGGDEFAVVLASTGVDVARRRATSLVEAVRAQSWQDLASGLDISLSVGIATGKPDEFSELMERADRALYEAKATGRGVVVCDSLGELLPGEQAPVRPAAQSM